MRRTMIGVVAAALMLVGGGAQASETAARPLVAQCQAHRAGTAIVVSGQAFSPGATTISLTCRVYVNGQLVGSVSSSLPGSAVAVAGVINNAPPGQVSVCTEASSRELDGTTLRIDNC